MAYHGTKFLNGTINKNYAILIPHANANESNANSDEEEDEEYQLEPKSTFGSSLSTLLWIIHAGFIKSVDYFWIHRRDNEGAIWKGTKNIRGPVETKFIHIFKYMQLNAIKIKQFSLDLDDYEEIWQALLLLFQSQELLRLMQKSANVWKSAFTPKWKRRKKPNATFVWMATRNTPFQQRTVALRASLLT
uniref:Uncharacterized protein n=1 Tax=Acrobeloides nanus TaxID=290746 RepID=A0A914EI97_9BILA